MDPRILDLGISLRSAVSFTPRPLYSGERDPGTHWIGVGHRTGLDDVEKRKILVPPVLEIRPLRRLARSQSLYRLSYGANKNI
jgi:hypothetical protein